MSSSLRAYRWIGACAERNRMASMPSCSCALCLLGFAASPACVRWSPIPDEADEDARRSVRERTELLSDRVGLTNRIGAVLATLGVNDYNPLLQSRRRRLAELRTGLGEPIPPNALAKIERLLARLELVLAQIAELERERDEVAAADAPDRAGKMIQQLTRPARHRRAKRNRAGSRGLCTTLFQWQGARLICRPYFDSV